jgi:glutamate synthase (NADPH) small chain
VQVSINLKGSSGRSTDNPWPEWPLIYRKTYAIDEGGVEEFSVEANEFVDSDADGFVNFLSFDRVEWTYQIKNGRAVRQDRKVLEQGLRTPADLILIAIGFQGAESGPFSNAGIELTSRGTLKTDRDMMTNLPGIFAAGDANRGQSIVVWAIGEGRDVAWCIDKYLMGSSRLQASLRTSNPPIGRI